MARKLAKVLDLPEADLLRYCNKEKVAIGEGKNQYIALQYSPTVKRLIKIRPENLPQIDQLIDEILEKQNEARNQD